MSSFNQSSQIKEINHIDRFVEEIINEIIVKAQNIFRKYPVIFIVIQGLYQKKVAYNIRKSEF